MVKRCLAFVLFLFSTCLVFLPPHTGCAEPRSILKLNHVLHGERQSIPKNLEEVTAFEKHIWTSGEALPIATANTTREKRKAFEDMLDKNIKKKEGLPQPKSRQSPTPKGASVTPRTNPQTLGLTPRGSPFPIFDAEQDSKWRGGNIRQGYISGRTFSRKAVQYTGYDGLAMFEGDIVLGTVKEMEDAKTQIEQQPHQSENETEPLGLVISGNRFRWPDGIVPYTIQEDIPPELRGRVFEAIDHWQELTPIQLPERSDQHNYLTFRKGKPGTHCSSRVGMSRGQQFINLEPRCDTGSIIHEIGHAVGLWHEQSREDRDQYITIMWENIEPRFQHNFNQHITDGDDIGPYDYQSIMHYPEWAFGMDRKRPTIVAPQPIGQREALSEGDISTVYEMYGKD